jgi:hypothetical protein
MLGADIWNQMTKIGSPSQKVAYCLESPFIAYMINSFLPDFVIFII